MSSRSEHLIEVQVPDADLAWLVGDESVERLEDGTYRVTAKGAEWLAEWLRGRLSELERKQRRLDAAFAYLAGYEFVKTAIRSRGEDVIRGAVALALDEADRAQA